MADLAKLFAGARSRFECWKTSAYREGDQEAWAIVQTHFTRIDPEHIAQVGLVGPDGKEIPLHLVYDQVMSATRFS